MRLAARMYETYDLERYTLKKRVGVAEFEILKL